MVTSIAIGEITCIAMSPDNGDNKMAYIMRA